MPGHIWMLLCCLALLTGCLTGCGANPAPEPCPATKVLAYTDSSADELARNSAPYRASGNPYEPGPLEVFSTQVTPCDAGCPLPLDIYAPAVPGTYAVVQFQHGFMMDVGYYSELLRHLASHGFVVVAPQMYPAGDLPVGQPLIREEAESLLALADWISLHLHAAEGVNTHRTALGLAGHSRGGKVAWLAASWRPERFRALAGVDPMDGTLGGWTQVIEGSFSFDLPSLAIGAGMGSLPARIPGMTCAPEGQNHEQFYAASPSPAWHAVVPEGGHADVINDDIAGCGVACSYCPSGLNPAGMRQVTAGLLAAFFRASLQGDETAMQYLGEPSAAPMPITIESR